MIYRFGEPWVDLYRGIFYIFLKMKIFRFLYMYTPQTINWIFLLPKYCSGVVKTSKMKLLSEIRVMWFTYTLSQILTAEISAVKTRPVYNMLFRQQSMTGGMFTFWEKEVPICLVPLFENIFIPVAEYRGILKRKKIRVPGIDTPIEPVKKSL